MADNADSHRFQDSRLESAKTKASDKTGSPSPTANSLLQPCERFLVESCSICYGSLHNIWHGASSPALTTFPSLVQPRVSGTVKNQQLDHNLPARNGVWSVFRLVNTKSHDREVCGWFVCHEDVNPEKEIDKILSVSGSPYELDAGSSLNNDETAEAGVLVINRYDWGHHDPRGKDLYPDTSEAFLTAGIVDRVHAEDEVNRWKDRSARERTASKYGVWMYIPQSEYLFGRFGFDNAKANAQSFLVFTGNTHFTRTAFSRLDKTLRKEETHEERFERRLHQGYDFSGIKTLKEMVRPPPFPVSQVYKYEPPPRNQWLGPYDLNNHIFRPSDIDALRLYTHVIEIADQVLGQVTDLVNEMVMIYLEQFILPHCSCNNMGQAVTAMFPNCPDAGYPRTLISYLRKHFTNASTDPPIECGYEGGAVNTRIRAFLTSRTGTGSTQSVAGTRAISPMALDDDCIAGLNRVVAFLVTEMMEDAQNTARDSWRDRMVPSDFRITIFNDHELRTIFQYSRVYWEGR